MLSLVKLKQFIMNFNKTKPPKLIKNKTTN